ncbi:hypothetical protein ABZ477_02595 [Microbacterium sp. NPDC019599]|uniref:hypothetical protein n=1 Tax=Microbacterium sp. NPDC019599 TaxID=3154690 RepID=UPI0033D72ECE
MMLQDLRTSAMPYGHNENDGFGARVASGDPDVAKLIHDALPSHSYRHWRLADSVRDYVDSALWHLVDGNLHLELQYFAHPSASESKPSAFRVEIVDAERVVRRWGRYAYLGAGNGRPSSSSGASEPQRDGKQLIVAALPKTLRHTVDAALGLIRAEDADFKVASSFVLGEHGADSGFDFGTHRRMSNEIVLRGTRGIGWVGRGTLSEDLLDPEKAWRAIRFARFAGQLRDVAVAALNEAIGRAGTRIGFEGAIELTGILTRRELDELEAELAAGTRPIAEIIFPRPTSALS